MKKFLKTYVLGNFFNMIETDKVWQSPLKKVFLQSNLENN